MINEKFKYLRLKSNLTMDKMAEKMNSTLGTKISKSMISSWENGRYSPSLETIENYSSFFDINIFYFINNGIDTELDTLFYNDEDSDFTKKEDIALKKEKEQKYFREIIEKNLNDMNAESLYKTAEYIIDIRRLQEYLEKDEKNNNA